MVDIDEMKLTGKTIYSLACYTRVEGRLCLMETPDGAFWFGSRDDAEKHKEAMIDQLAEAYGFIHGEHLEVVIGEHGPPLEIVERGMLN